MIKIKRRDLLLGLSVASGAMTLSSQKLFASSPRKLKILILGGTGYIGPHIVREALSRGHELTLFNRGRSNTDLFPEVEKRVGDRDGDLASLEKGQWDAVIDNSGYVPRHVGDSAELLKDRAGRYLFTSSVSVYDFKAGVYPWTRGSKLAPWTNPDSEEVGKYYGEFKARCEHLVESSFGERATVVRPTYIVGPGDRSQRFPWWLVRVTRGGDVLAPGNPDTSFDLIDVRDLASFYIRLLEDDRPGVFNASGPAGRFSFGGMLNGIRAATSNPVNFHWVESSFLNGEGVTWKEVPMWTSELDGITGLIVEHQSSVEAGLQYRPFIETVNDTLDWQRKLPQDEQVFTRTGITPEKESAVLAAWQAHRRAS